MALKKKEPPPTIVRAGLSDEEKRAFARKNNIIRRHLTREQVRRIIAEQLKETPNWADNRIAGEIGVDSKTVGTVRGELEATSEIPKLNRLVGADGKERPAKRPRTPRVMQTDDDKHVDRDRFRAITGFKESDLDAHPEMKALLFDIDVSKSSFGGFINDDRPAPPESWIREWAHFAEFLIEYCHFNPDGACAHAEWVAGRFDTADEWLGDEGDKMRRIWSMRVLDNQIRRLWETRDISRLDQLVDRRITDHAADQTAG